MSEAVDVGRILHTFSVDNDGCMAGKLVSTCARSCTGALITGVFGCIERNIGLVSVYVVLTSHYHTRYTPICFAYRGLSEFTLLCRV